MNWKGKRVLITGAGGFIGSHLAERLVERGARVRAFVHYRGDGSTGWLEESPHRDSMDILAGDIRDASFVQRAVDGADCVFHLAALIAIPFSYEAPESYVDTNVSGTLHVLQASRAARTPRIVHTSTSEVYGTARYVPIDENHPLQGQSPYSASKIGADKLAEAFHLSYGLPVVTVRPFNTFGPRQSARAVIPTIISQCLAGGPVRLGNLSPRRDLNFVSNTVDGFIAAAERPGILGQTFNLGSGQEVAIGALVKRIGELAGRPVRLVTETRRQRPPGSEVERLLADSRRAARLLKWHPRVSLEDGLRRTIAWMDQHPDAHRPARYAI